MPSSTTTTAYSSGRGGDDDHGQQPQPRRLRNNSHATSSATTVQQPPHPSHEFTFAKRTLRKLVEDSEFFSPLQDDNNNTTRVGTIHEKDVQVGGLLGQGGFCEVRYCVVGRRQPPQQQQQGGDNNNNNNNMARYYAIKYLSPTRTAPHPSDPKNKVFQRGIADLAMEACFLSLLSHTNIITCHYVSEGSLEENFNTNNTDHRVEDVDSVAAAGGGGRGGGGSGGRGRNTVNQTIQMKKKRFKEEIVLDAMGNLVLREVPIEDETTTAAAAAAGGEEVVVEKEEDKEEHDPSSSSLQPVEKYKHRFGYFLLLDVLHETLAHRIDHVYIPQVLLSSSSSSSSSSSPMSSYNTSLPSTDLTSSLLLHTHEKRVSFLKRMTSLKQRSSSLFHKQQHHHQQQHSTMDSSLVNNSNSSSAFANNNFYHHHHDSNYHQSNDFPQHQPQSQHSHHHHHNLVYNQKQKLAQRLTSLLSIANALQYLHEHHILFRDIKPDNIGFYRDYSSVCTCGARGPISSSSISSSSSTGGQQQQQQQQDGGGGISNNKNKKREECTCYIEIPKLFDFGLAKELKSKYRVIDGQRRLRTSSYSENKEYAHHDHRGGNGVGLLKTLSSGGGSTTTLRQNRSITDTEMNNTVYKLTGCTGSRRYMAPEVCFNDPYNEKADVYSFGMMLYQVASLVTPFDGYSSYDHEKEVLRGGYRPDIDLPTKKDLLVCKKIEEELYANLNDGGSSSSGNDDDGSAGNKLLQLLPPPSEKRNEVLAIKSKSVWTKDLKRLIDECWDYDMRYRPPMKEVVVRLQGCIDELTLSAQQLQQQKKGRDSLEAKKRTNDVIIRGSRNNNVNTHRQGERILMGVEKMNDNVVEGMTKQKVTNGVGAVELRSNVSYDDDGSSRENVNKKSSFFRRPTNPGKESAIQ